MANRWENGSALQAYFLAGTMSGQRGKGRMLGEGCPPEGPTQKEEG